MLEQPHYRYQIIRNAPGTLPQRECLCYTNHAASALTIVTAVSKAKPDAEYAVYGSTDPKHPIARYRAGERL